MLDPESQIFPSTPTDNFFAPPDSPDSFLNPGHSFTSTIKRPWPFARPTSTPEAIRLLDPVGYPTDRPILDTAIPMLPPHLNLKNLKKQTTIEPSVPTSRPLPQLSFSSFPPFSPSQSNPIYCPSSTPVVSSQPQRDDFPTKWAEKPKIPFHVSFKTLQHPISETDWTNVSSPYPTLKKRARPTIAIMENVLWVSAKKYPLEKFENAYAISPSEVVIHFRGETPMRHCFENGRAEEFVPILFEKAVAHRWRCLDKAIEFLLRRSMTDMDIEPGSYVKISESLLGNSTEQTARVLWISSKDDMITVQLPTGSEKLPKWYVTGMVDPYDIVRLRTFAEETLSRLHSWEPNVEIQEVKILRDMVSKTVDWIVNDNFGKWSDEYFIEGHELDKTEVTVLVDQKLMHHYLKRQLSEVRKHDIEFREAIEVLDAEPSRFWTQDVNELHLYKRGTQHLLNQDRKPLYGRIDKLTRMVEEYNSHLDDETKLLNYLLYSFVKASSLCMPLTPLDRPSKHSRCLLTRLDLHLMITLSHPEFLTKKRTRALQLFSRVFTALERLTLEIKQS